MAGMKITIKELREIIAETLYDAYRTKSGKRSGDPVRVDAPDTVTAGKEAAQLFGGNIDPFTIDLEQIKQPKDDGSETPHRTENDIKRIEQLMADIVASVNSPYYVYEPSNPSIGKLPAMGSQTSGSLRPSVHFNVVVGRWIVTIHTPQPSFQVFYATDSAQATIKMLELLLLKIHAIKSVPAAPQHYIVPNIALTIMKDTGYFTPAYKWEKITF